MIKILYDTIRNCTKCPLHTTRTNVVICYGSLAAKIAFIGEAPGADEDREGVPFVGRAGKLLDKVFKEVGIDRREIWIGNILKCRPPDNRNPSPEESDQCMPYLERQLELLNPKVIVCLGAVPSARLLGVLSGITKVRGTWMEYKGIKALPTLHPSYVLRNMSKMKYLAEDIRKAKEYCI